MNVAGVWREAWWWVCAVTAALAFAGLCGLLVFEAFIDPSQETDTGKGKGE